jgi:signal transduction histidine kinase
MHRPYIRRLTFKQILPLSMGGLLLAVVLLDSAASYASVKSASLAVGRERLRSAVDQVAELMTTSAANTQRTMQTAASDSTVVRFLRAPGAADRAAALATIRKPGAPTSQKIAAELWSNERQFIVTSAAINAPHGDIAAEIERASTAPNHVAIGRLRVERDTIVLPIVAAVLDGDRQIGYYAEWHRVVTTPAARGPLLKLIGPNSALLIGNDSGTVWTDLAKVVPPPPVDVRAAKEIADYSTPDQGAVFATARAVAGAPWYVVVELAQDSMLAAPNQFIKRAVLIGFVLVILGFVAVSQVSTVITARLDRAQADMLETERLNTLSTLGAGLAHDMNNLLFSIGLSAKQLRGETDSGKPVRPELLDRIASATTDAGRLVQYLMAFARPDQGGAPPAWVESGTAVAAHEDLLRLLLPRAIALRVIVDPGTNTLRLPAPVIEHMLVNLVSNARDTLPDGGEITVHLRETQVDGTARVVLEVGATGQAAAVRVAFPAAGALDAARTANPFPVGR